ncbi:MAG: YkgJ family cysteine cluster protein, partial [Proteobacteria bacterium]|nr:YkgJ family cysteine cluster protein [Pseudomonadota bacterium]
VPCMELMPICKARCCRLRFSLSSRDLDEGVIRWDYGKPYQIRQRASDGYCVHNDHATGGCTTHAHRPKVCRTYSCKDDKRIWLDFDNRIVAPFEAIFRAPERLGPIDLVGRLRERRLARELERSAVEEAFAEPGPREGT